MLVIQLMLSSKIRDFDSSVAEDSSLLGCGTVSTGKQLTDASKYCSAFTLRVTENAQCA
jgi:hypothetical protein